VKARLEFDLPEETYEFHSAISGADWCHAMWNLDQEMRGIDRSKVPVDEWAKTVRDYPNEFLASELSDVPKEHVRIVTEAWRIRLYAMLQEAGLDFEG
jgi:hypothetical protein